MSTATQPQHHLDLTVETKPSSYDRLSALLVALVVVIGFLVFIMFMIWLTMVVDFRSRVQPPMMEHMAGNDNRPEGVADDWQEPGVEEFPEIEKPQLADALEAVTDAVSTVKAQLEKIDGNAPLMGRGPGLGDRRSKGPGTGNANIIPESKRWKIEYAAGTMIEYMTILDSFGVTMGAVSQLSNQIHYVDDLLSTSPRFIVGDRENEKRLYFMNTRNRLRRWDTNKVVQSGIDSRNKLVVQFYEEPVRATLRQLEQAVYVREGRSLSEVKQTIFRVRPAGSGYEFYVENITYRPKPN